MGKNPSFLTITSINKETNTKQMHMDVVNTVIAYQCDINVVTTAYDSHVLFFAYDLC